MNSDSSTTIAAIATAPGKAGVAAIRVSGPFAWDIAKALTGKTIEPTSAPKVLYSSLRHPDEKRDLIDDALVLYFKAPRSYTGEDVVEFHCHGGYITPNRVLEACFAAGARLAERGEFTRRAFLNGKLSYEEAESVIDLIDAKTSRAAASALEGLSGNRSNELRSLYDKTLALSSRLEYSLDVDESDLTDEFTLSIQNEALELTRDLKLVLKRSRESKILRRGSLVVLSGEPNIGKSSLMNALLGENRAIVSDIAGTTRDSIEEWLDIDGWPIRLVDTAGLRDTEDSIEAEGVERSKNLMAQADIVLQLVEKPCSPSSKKSIVVVTKCDLIATKSSECVFTSAKTLEGLDDLRLAIARMLERNADLTAVDGDYAYTNGREDALLSSLSLLSSESFKVESFDPVLAANDARRAAQILGEAIGAEYSSDLIDNLFSRFCVGK